MNSEANEPDDDESYQFLNSTTGIPWLDKVVGAMRPLSQPRIISVLGGPGSGKTMLAMQLLVAASGKNRGLLMLGEETLSVAVERLNALRTVQEMRDAHDRMTDSVARRASRPRVDAIDILGRCSDEERVSILRTMRAGVVVLDLPPPLNGDTHLAFVRRCQDAVSSRTVLIFTGNTSSLEHAADVSLMLSDRREVAGATRVRLSCRKNRFAVTPKTSALLEVSHQVVTHRGQGVGSTVESRSLVQVEIE
jgi:hypothetical protein